MKHHLVMKRSGVNLQGKPVMKAVCLHTDDGVTSEAWSHMTAYQRGRGARAARRYLERRWEDHVKEYSRNKPTGS